MATKSQQERDVIVLEFNELVPRLMTRFMGEGMLPNFRRLFGESHVYTTDASESGPALNPWVQWVTAHCGQSFAEHQIQTLVDGHKLTAPNVWDVVSEAGHRVWVCGSMNCSVRGAVAGAVLPDPWSVGVDARPSELEHYNRFVRQNVQEHTASSRPATLADAVRFVLFMLTHGLSSRTVSSIVRQLVGERRAGGKSKWKRVGLMDRLQWDLFRRYYRLIRPRLSTFFLNSTAHLQHRFWRNMEPEQFMLPPETDSPELADAIPWGYRQMDRLVGQFMELAGPNTTLVFCTALSQQPFVRFDGAGGKRMYRLHDPRKFLETLQVSTDCEVMPVMAEEFVLKFRHDADAERAEQSLRQLRMDDKNLMYVARDAHEVHACCVVRKALGPEASIKSVASSSDLKFFDHFYEIDTLKSGYHHPHGMLWIRTPERRHTVVEEPVPLTILAPTILSLLGCKQPATMRSAPLDLGTSQPLSRVA